MRRCLAVSAAVLLSALSAPGVLAQVQPDPSRPLVLTHITEDRWIHEGQHADFVPFETASTELQLRFRRNNVAGGSRLLTLSSRNVEAQLTLDLRNHLRSARFSLPSVYYSQYDDARDRAATRRRRLFAPGATLNLPAARFWEVPFLLPGREMSAGLTWTDTLSFLADPGEGLSENLEGVWAFRVVGDTTIGGRTLPLVQVEARVRYTSVELVEDWSMVDPLRVERDVAGTVRGWAALDTVIGVRALGADTASWDGVAVLHTQDGRALPSEVRYERTRSWVLRDSTDWAVRQDSLSAARRAQGTGMLRLPRTAVQDRLRQGDALLADSLVLAWNDADRVQDRLEIERLLSTWLPRGAAQPGSGLAVREEATGVIGALRVEAGDTAFAIVADLNRAASQPRLTQQVLDRSLPYLDDLGRLWRLGVWPATRYQNLADRLLVSTPILEPDSSLWRCEPAACERLRAVARNATEPRLRDVGLVGDFALDPARFYEGLQSRAESGSLVGQSAIWLAEGVGATWTAAAKAPIPETGAEWRAWLVWLGGVGRFHAQHRNALDMHRARTGRDAVAELRAAWPPAGDSARLVLSEILLAMGALDRPTIDEVAAALLSDSEPRRRGARAELPRIVGPDAAEAPSELALELLLPSLSTLIEDSFGVNVPIFVLNEDLPPGLADALGDRAQVVDTEEWAARPLRLGGVIIRVEPVRTNGPFARYGWDWTVYRPRSADEAPSGYAGGLTRWLLRTEEGWRVVEAAVWIS